MHWRLLLQKAGQRVRIACSKPTLSQLLDHIYLPEWSKYENVINMPTQTCDCCSSPRKI